MSSLRASRSRSRSLSQGGFSLLELLAAMAVFVLVILAAYQVFERSHEGYVRGQNQSEMIQSARVGFDQMTNDIRMAGFEFDIDGNVVSYPNQADEAIEYLGAHAISVRANFNFESGAPGDAQAAFRGREPGLERRPAEGAENFSIDECCPIVTTSNEEVVTYALGKNPGDPDAPAGDGTTLEVKFDTTGTEAVEAPDPDSGYADGDIRDGFIDAAGVIHDEETLTIPNLALSSFDDPPYVLYKFTFKPDGSVTRRPLVDNVRSLDFTYYNEGGTVIAPNEGADAGRDARWLVRRVAVNLVAMEPEADRRYVDAGDSNPNSRRHRKYRLTEDVFPPNMGRRGQIDKSVNAPSPVDTITLCSGQCGMLRVSWNPPPPEDRVKDYIVQLFDGTPLDSGTNRRASFVVVSNFDLTTVPNKEYAVFTVEDDSDITEDPEPPPPITFFARVIARNDGGAESERTDSVTGVAVTSATRPEAIRSAYASGYDPTGDAWPDAAPNNASGALIETSPTVDVGDPPVAEENPYYPQANAIHVTLRSPQFTLNSSTSAPGPPRWTTKDLGGDVEAPMACHRQESTPADVSDDPAYRTPLENLPRNPLTRNLYVFRVSGSEEDRWSWDGGRAGITVADPRNFVPGPENLHDFTWLPLHTEEVTYVDDSLSFFHAPSGSTSQYEERFDGTKARVVSIADIPAADWDNIRGKVPQAVVPGEVYYYRFRAASLCWKDKVDGAGNDRPDGVHDDYQDAANPLTAWSLREDFATDVAWREASLSLSPFYPPLLPVGSATGERDKPLQSVHDSDEDTRSSGFDCYAIPGYTIPAIGAVTAAYIPPEMPTELYLARRIPGDPDDDSVQVIFNAAKRNAPDVSDGVPRPVAYARYELHRHPGSSDSPTVDEQEFTPSDSTLYLTFRTDGHLSLLNYTLDTRDGSVDGGGEDAPNSDEYPSELGDVTDVGASGHSYIWRLVTKQCDAFDDGIDTASAASSAPSRPFVFPCDFYDQVSAVDITPTPDLVSTTNVNVIVSMLDAPPPDGVDDPTCAALASARLIAFRASGDMSGEYIGTSDWQDVGDGCTFDFDTTAIAKARRDYSDQVRYEVEVADLANAGRSGLDAANGCSVRSDHLGWAYEAPTESLGCEADCGTNDSPLILGAVTDASVTGGPDLAQIDINLPIICTVNDFALHQIEVDLIREADEDGDTVNDPMPEFSVAEFYTGTTGFTTLPTPDTDETGIDCPAPAAGPGCRWDGTDQSLRLRWYDTITADPPVVNNSAPTLGLRLTFEGSACGIRVAALNFRVQVTGETDGEPNELLCTNRDPDTDPDPDAVVGGLTPGAGRGPEDTPSVGCELCSTSCAECPLNDDMGTWSAANVELLGSDIGDPVSGLIRVSFQEDCVGDSDCALVLTYVHLTVGTNQTTRLCEDNPLFFPDNLARGFYQSDTSAEGDEVLLETLNIISENGCIQEYEWTGVIDVNITPGDEFFLDFHFNGNMDGTEIQDLDLTFGDPFDSPTSCTPEILPVPVD